MYFKYTITRADVYQKQVFLMKLIFFLQLYCLYKYKYLANANDGLKIVTVYRNI